MNRIIFAIIYVFILSRPAHAYLDPITGSILIQAIFAGGATVVVFFRKRVFSIFKRKKLKNQDDHTTNDSDATK
jgi:hypothetical protein